MPGAIKYPVVKRAPPFGLLLLVVTTGYIVALWLESWLKHEASGTSYALFSMGILVGGLTKIRLNQWPAMIGLLIMIRLAWLLMFAPTNELGHWIAMASIELLIGIFIASAPFVLLPERKRDFLPNEMFAVLVFNGVIGAIGFALVTHHASSADSQLTLASAACGVLLGTGIGGAPLTIWGMVYGRPAKYPLSRIALLAVSVPGFLLLGTVALTGYPQGVADVLAPYGNVALWLALFFAMIVANNLSSPAMIGLLMMMAMTSAVLFHFQPGSTDISAVLRWQSTALGIEVVVLVCAALIAGQRRLRQLYMHRDYIAESMLAASAAAANDTSRSGRVDLFDALEIAGRHCRADECRLYSFDNISEQALCVNVWLRDPALVDRLQLVEPIALQALRDITEPLSRGKPFFWEHTDTESSVLPEFGNAMLLQSGSEIAFYPIQLGEQLLGMIGIVGYSLDQLRKRNAPTLLNGIGYYYVGIHTQREAARSIARYEASLSELAARFAQAEERVRRDTSVEIHDGIIQQLAVMRMKLGELGQRRVSAPETLTNITAIVDETLQESRSMLQRLSPSVLYELGLMPALQNLCDTINEEGHFDVTLRESGARIKMDQDIRVAFYHVLKELIDNSHKHSGGNRIWVDIAWSANGIEQATVSDNGDTGVWWLLRRNRNKADQLGLLAASERLQRFDYLLTFLPREGGGTSAAIRQAMIFSVPEPA